MSNLCKKKVFWGLVMVYQYLNGTQFKNAFSYLIGSHTKIYYFESIHSIWIISCVLMSDFLTLLISYVLTSSSSMIRDILKFLFYNYIIYLQSTSNTSLALR